MKKLVVLLPVLSGVLWGSAGVFVRDLTEMGMDDYTLLSSRMIVAAAAVFLGICLYDRSLLKIRPKDLWIFLGGGVLGMLGLSFCYNIAISQLTLSLAAVLLSLSPVFVLLLSAVLFREKVTGRKVGCMAAALAGCALASGVLESASGMQWTVSGILVGLMGAFFYGLYSIFTKVAMERGVPLLHHHPLLHGGGGPGAFALHGLGVSGADGDGGRPVHVAVHAAPLPVHLRPPLRVLHPGVKIHGRGEGVHPGGLRAGGGHGVRHPVFQGNAHGSVPGGPVPDGAGPDFPQHA